MRNSGLMRLSLLALGLAVLPLATGCGSNPFNPPVDDGGGGLPADTPMNDSPSNTMIRFERTYENQVVDQYELLFASNFRFTFSNQSDPTLVNQYGNSWGKDDEVESTSHLFDGFTNELGTFVPGAAGITLSLPGAQIIADPFRPTDPDSSAYYKYVIVPSISLLLDVPGTQGYEIAAPHDFYLVRGDAAVLDAGQQATADRWYIWRWDDKSAALAAIAPRLQSLAVTDRPAAITWGNLKGSYAK